MKIKLKGLEIKTRKTKYFSLIDINSGQAGHLIINIIENGVVNPYIIDIDTVSIID